MSTVVHTYLTHCQINPQPPGFADYIRGTLVLYQKSRQYGYKLEIDYSHPLLKFLKNSNDKQYDGPVHELICPIDFQVQDTIINNLFSSGQNFNLLTNIYPINFHNIILDSDTKIFLKEFLTPNYEVSNMISKIIPNNGYVVVHIRTGDSYMLNNIDINNDKLYILTRNLIKQLDGQSIVLMSDNLILKNTFAREFKHIFVSNIIPIHTGSLAENPDDRLKGVLTEFGLLCKSQKNYCVSKCEGGSGYSYIASLIYDIPYEKLY